jgi:hypothetical protein
MHDDREQAGNDSGDEQFADILLGDEAIDHQHRRGRQHGAERAADRDHAGRERLRIVETAHFRIGDRRKRRGGRDRRAGDRGERPARCDRRNAEAASPMTDERVGGPKQLAADAGDRNESAHQQEHRDDAEGIVGHRAHRGLADQLHRRPKAGETTEAGDADEPHRHADRHAQQHQCEEADEPDDRHDLAVHSNYSAVFTLASWMSSG